MIARMWHGRVPAAKAAAYEHYLDESGLAAYKDTPGNRGVYLLTRTEGDITHIVTLTFWESIDAIKAFAGDDYSRARYFAEDDAYLLERERDVVHYEVRRAPEPVA